MISTPDHVIHANNHVISLPDHVIRANGHGNCSDYRVAADRSVDYNNHVTYSDDHVIRFGDCARRIVDRVNGHVMVEVYHVVYDRKISKIACHLTGTGGHVMIEIGPTNRPGDHVIPDNNHVIVRNDHVVALDRVLACVDHATAEGHVVCWTDDDAADNADHVTRTLATDSHVMARECHEVEHVIFARLSGLKCDR